MEVSEPLHKMVRRCLPERYKERSAAKHKQLMPSNDVLRRRIAKLGMVAGRESLQRTIRLAGEKAYELSALIQDLDQCVQMMAGDDGSDPQVNKLWRSVQRASVEATKTRQNLVAFMKRTQRALDDGDFMQTKAAAGAVASADLPGLPRQMRFITDPSQIRIGPKCGVSVRSFTSGKWAPLPMRRLYRLQGGARRKLNRCLKENGMPMLLETAEVQDLLKHHSANAATDPPQVTNIDRLQGRAQDAHTRLQTILNIGF